MTDYSGDKIEKEMGEAYGMYWGKRGAYRM
jgi:hypothetical protein